MWLLRRRRKRRACAELRAASPLAGRRAAYTRAPMHGRTAAPTPADRQPTPRPMTDRAPLDVASLSHPGHGPLAQRGLGLRRRRRRHRRARRRHGRLQRRRGRERHRGQRRVSNGMLPELRLGPRAVEGRHRERAHARARCCCSSRSPPANKGIYEAAQARPECAGMGTTIVAAVFCGNRVSHRPHRRLALLPAARREVRAADARPLAAAGADRQRRCSRPSRPSTRSTRTSSRARSASRRSCPPTSSSTGSRPNDIYLLVLGRPHRHGRARRHPHDRRRQAQPTWPRPPPS